MNLMHFRYCNAFCSICYRFQCSSTSHLPVANEIIQKYTRGKEVFTSEQSDSVYIVNPDVASQISSCIVKEWNRGYLLEANPGPGLLSNSLLQNGINLLRVFERKKEFLSVLKVLADEYPLLEIVQQDLMLLPSVEYRKNLETCGLSNNVKEFFESVFKDIPQHPWENGTSFQIFSTIASKRSHKFLRYLLVALPNRSSIFSFGRCDFFFLISETEYMSMKALPKENYRLYRWSTVLYNIFFDIKFLDKFPSNSNNFLFCKRTAPKKIAHKYFYLIKMTPKSDLYAHSMSSEKLKDFTVFVRSHLVKRSDLVIKSIEQWIPYCGPRLIKEGMTVFTKFGDLSPSEILWLFNCLSSWPEYQHSNLQAFVNKFNKNFIRDE